MEKNLIDLVKGINLSKVPIAAIKLNNYGKRAFAGSDCCYGADCGDCDCGGYCISGDCCDASPMYSKSGKSSGDCAADCSSDCAGDCGDCAGTDS
jgi:hypothetical protein